MKKELFALTIVSFCLSAQTPILIEGDGYNLKLGILLQPAFESLGSSKDEGTIQNLFVRRIRLMSTGSLGDKFEYFIGTDNYNIEKVAHDGSKRKEGLAIRDAVLTYKLTEKIKLDAGLILTPFAHLSTQGASSLHSWDYSTYGFLQSGPIGCSTGRDSGAQLRGIVGKKHGNLEFRVGVWQGKKERQASDTDDRRNGLRYAGRLQWNFFEAEGGLYLGGTSFGTKKILALGIGYDRQEDYNATAFDFYVDMPIGANGIMGQWNRIMWDGGTWLPTLLKQKTDFAELGYRIGAYKLSPMLRFEARSMDIPTVANPDETRMGAGLAWWLNGHQNNFKAFFTRVEPKNISGSKIYQPYNQINFQWQVLFW